MLLIRKPSLAVVRCHMCYCPLPIVQAHTQGTRNSWQLCDWTKVLSELKMCFPDTRPLLHTLGWLMPVCTASLYNGEIWWGRGHKLQWKIKRSLKRELAAVVEPLLAIGRAADDFKASSEVSRTDCDRPVCCTYIHAYKQLGTLASG